MTGLIGDSAGPGRACDVIIAAGRRDVPALKRALRLCLDEQANWSTVRMGPGPMLETVRPDPDANALLDELYDGAHAGA